MEMQAILIAEKKGIYKKLSGFITHSEMKKIHAISRKPRSPQRNMRVKKWLCRQCDSSFFYAALKCPSCESPGMKEISIPALYNGDYSV